MISTLLAAAAALLLTSTSTALPVNKRIAQTIDQSTAAWVQACNAAGGDPSTCQTLSQTAFMTLLAAAGPCDQQNAADAMVTFAKTLNNNNQVITLAQVFVQQPRNSPDSLSVPYCQTDPQNQELAGLFQCQFEGVDPNTFFNNVQLGAPGTFPLGFSSALSPAGSCAANPSGPIAPGSQLESITQNPGTPLTPGGSSGSAAPPAAAPAQSSAAAAAASSPSAAPDSAPAVSTVTVTAAGACTAAAAAAPAPTSSSTDSASSAPSSSFALANGQSAQSQNAGFASLTASSSCTAGQNACVTGQFAQCVGGSFVLEGCAAGTSCFALPLVNSRGTSIACTTQSDADARFAATGVTSGSSGNGN